MVTQASRVIALHYIPSGDLREDQITIGVTLRVRLLKSGMFWDLSIVMASVLIHTDRDW